jgi:hypothetical protein
MKLLIMQSSPTFHHFFLVHPNILLSTLFPGTLSLCSSPKCERPSFTPITVKFNANFNFYVFRVETRRQIVWREWYKALPKFHLILISSWIQFFLSLLSSKQWFFCALWWQYTTIYLTFSVFISRITSVLASDSFCVFLYSAHVLPHILTS